MQTTQKHSEPTTRGELNQAASDPLAQLEELVQQRAAAIQSVLDDQAIAEESTAARIADTERIRADFVTFVEGLDESERVALRQSLEERDGEQDPVEWAVERFVELASHLHTYNEGSERS